MFLFNKPLQKQKLVLGCGKNALHTDVHPPHEWLSIDIDPNVHPDVIADVRYRHLEELLRERKRLPENGFKIIFIENICIDVLMNENLRNNVYRILNGQGLLLVNNANNESIATLKNNFSSIFFMPPWVVLTNKPTSIVSVIKELCNANINDGPFHRFIEKLKDMQKISEAMHHPIEMQPMMSAYIYLKQYLEIDARQDIDTLSNTYSACPTVDSLLRDHPEMNTYLHNEKISSRLKVPLYRLYLKHYLSKDKAFLHETMEVSDRNFDSFFRVDANKNLTLSYLITDTIPKAFQLGDADDHEHFNEIRNQDMTSPKRIENTFDKKQCDEFFQIFFSKLQHVLEENSADGLEALKSKLEKHSNLFDCQQNYTNNFSHDFIEHLYKQDSDFLYHHCQTMVNVVLDSHKKLGESQTPKLVM